MKDNKNYKKAIQNEFKDKKNIIEGKNSVIESYKAGVKFKKLYVLNDIKDDRIIDIANRLKNEGIDVFYVDRKVLDNMSITKIHKGVIAEVEEYKYVDVDYIINSARSKNERLFMLILDEIEDPRNFGAIIRTADLLGIHGIVIKDKNSVKVNSLVMSSSSGAANFVKIAMVNNINRVIDYLKKNNVWIYSAEMDGKDIREVDFNGDICVVLGNEGKGVKKLTSEKSDFKISVPMKGHVDSYNVSVAASIIMYEIFRGR